MCVQVAKALAGLSRTRDSIGRATALALGGAGVGAAPRIIRLITDRIEKARHYIPTSIRKLSGDPWICDVAVALCHHPHNREPYQGGTRTGGMQEVV